MGNPMAQAARPSAPNPCATASSTAPPLSARHPNATPRTALGKVLLPSPDDMAQAARPSAPNPCAAASSAARPLPARLPNATPRTALDKDAPRPISGGSRDLSGQCKIPPEPCDAPRPISGGSTDLSGQCKIPPEHVMHKASGFTNIKPDARVKLVPAEDIPYVLHGKPFGRTVGPAKLQEVHSRLSVTSSRPPKAMAPLPPKAMAPLTHKASSPLTHKDATPITLKDAPCPTSGGSKDLSGQCKIRPEHAVRKASGGTYIKPDARVKLIPAEYITCVQRGKPFDRTVGSAKLQKGHCHKASALGAPCPTSGGYRGFSGQCKKPPEHVYVPFMPRKQLSDELGAVPCIKSHIKHEQKRRGGGVNEL